MGGPQNDVANAAAYDADGNTCVTGAFRGTATFGSATLTSVGNTDAFVAAYDPAGATLWAFAIRGPGAEIGNDILVERGLLHVTGSFSNGADFDPTGGFIPPNSGGRDAFVATYELLTTGPLLLWVVPIGGSGNDSGEDLGMHPLSPTNVWATGTFRGTAAFGGGVITSVGGSPDAYVAGFNAITGGLWGTWSVGGPGNDAGYGIDLARPNNPCITGHFQGTADFDPSGAVSTLSAFGALDAYVACYGAFAPPSYPFVPFAPFQIGGPTFDRGTDIAAGGQQLYVTGGFTNTANFNGPSFTSAGNVDAFVAAYDFGGSPLWVTPFGAARRAVRRYANTTFGG